jgi:hypothetical protein
MKYLLSSILFVFAIFATSCSKESDVTSADFESLDEVITMSRTFTVPGATRALDATFKFDATMDLASEKITSYSVKKIDINGDEIDPDFTQEELTAALIAELGEDFTDLQALEQAQDYVAQTTGLSDCLNKCQDKFTDGNGKRQKGRGNCRFGCWGEAVIDLLKTIAENFDWGILVN